MLATRGETPRAARAACVSGSGNVAIYAIEKVHASSAATSSACSDSAGFVVDDPAGIDLELLAQVKERRTRRASREYAEQHGGARRSCRAATVWDVACEPTSPCRAPRRTRSTRRTPRTCVAERRASRVARGGEHADDAGRGRSLPGRRHAVRPRQGGQRRRRRDLGPGDAAERVARLAGPARTPRRG